MRFAAMLAALAALFVQAGEAKAITWLISGSASGFIHGIASCSVGGCAVDTPFTQNFSLVVGSEASYPAQGVTFANGIYSFFYGFSSNDGVYQGTFRSIGNGLFEGLTLSYGQASGLPCHVGNLNCARDASATQFSVVQVTPSTTPEPTTWAMMLVGFGVMGASMRRGGQVWSLRSR